MIQIPSPALAALLTLLVALIGFVWKRTVGRLEADVKRMTERWEAFDQVVNDSRHELQRLVPYGKGGDETTRSMQRFLSALRREVWPEGRLRRGQVESE